MERYVKPLLVVSVAAALLLGGTALAQTRRIEAMNRQFSAYSARAAYESAEMMRGVESNLRKVSVSASVAQLQQHLGDVARQAQGAESAITTLPLTAEQVHTATKVINQMGDYAAVLSNKLARGGAITSEDAENIGQMIELAGTIQADIQNMIVEMETNGAITLGVQGEMPEAAVIDGAGSEYPALIYDGPFSDAAGEGEFRAVQGEVVSAGQAQQRLTDYMGKGRLDSVSLTGEADVPIPVYEFALKSGDVQMTAAVTKTGGHVLYLLPETEVDAARVPVPQCLAAAAQFLDWNGYGSMQVSYYYQSQNVLTISFAAKQDDVLLYPDLVKIQVSMKDGKIIGAECANYLKNHTVRTLPEVQISSDDALQRVNSHLQVQFIRMALIPINTQEYLTYEIAAKDEASNQYLIYIDAVSGQERQIYQLLTDENGTLAE